MNPLVQVLQKALRDELIVAREWIENEIYRLGGEEPKRLVGGERVAPEIVKPPNWANGEVQR